MGIGTSTSLCVWVWLPTGITDSVFSICCGIVCVFRKLNLNGRFGVFAVACIYMKYCFTLEPVFCFVQGLLGWHLLQVGTMLSVFWHNECLKRY